MKNGAMTYKPSDVVLLPIPLVGTMHKAEAEFAATLLVRACVRLGDTWQAVGPKELGMVIHADLAEEVEPLFGLRNNPFFHPDMLELVKRGYAKWTGKVGGAVQFTAEGFTAMERWVRGSKDDG